MSGFSIPAVLRERASVRPDEAAFTYIDYEQDRVGGAETLTWSQLYRRTLNVAQALKACGSVGDRAVVLAPQGLEYVVAFLGALQAGQIAVPLSAPLGGASDERVSAVLCDAAPSVILTTSSIAGNVAEYLESRPGARVPSLIEVDLLDLDAQQAPAVETAGRPSAAHLQYTSGSTRTPAGVMVSHRNIQVNCQQIIAAYYEDDGGVAPADTTVVSWLPLFHDMGLIFGIAFPVLGGFRTVLTSPPAFLQRPARWMQLLASNSHAFSAGPNIAFELAARKTSDDDMAGLDLGGVRNVLNGAERVNPPTLRRFADRFARFNLRPEVLRASYGLAEATLYVATRESGHPPETVFFESENLTGGHAKPCASGDGIPLVSYGVPQSPTVRIVDPETSTECPAGTVGEIWVHGDNVAEGYWQKPEESERTFGATIVGPSAGAPEAPWLRTGDLGFFSDGEMFIVGRIKDLLIVYGRNHAPDDIEATIQEITRGRCVAIAVSDDDGVEKLVTIVELKAPADSEEAMQKLRVVRREITSAISKSHGLSVADLVVVAPHSIPLTTSGKVRRRDCVQRYLGDEFTRLDKHARRPEPAEAADTGASTESDAGVAQRLRTLREQQRDLLVGVVCSEVATVLGRSSPEDIDPEWPFRDLGFDSVKATELLDRLKGVTGLELAPTLAFDYPTPGELATYLGRLMSGSVAAALPVGSQVVVDEPVAVVGMACRFPGGVDSAAALWDLVIGGTDAVGAFPGDRGWDLADLFDSDPDAVGKTYTRAGGFVADAGGFDAEFFGISAREAVAMDPQQRLLLEVCWEALETARIDPAALVGTQTGVFVGAWSQTYGGGGSDGSEGYGLTGSSTSVASGRVAYVLGLQGPALTVDTACSSSLVATHLACQSLRNGEATLAVAGGVTVMTTPAVFTEFARQRGLAADGRCKAFSAAADGTGWGEGAAVLVLERLGDARRNNHPVLAVIAGSAMNQDGASNGLTAPNGPAQQRVIAQAVANAGIGLDQVDVVEAHGTGTTLGDPIEAGALIATYGAARRAERPLWLGSIKSNIGHTQAAAGAAGLIKMVAALNQDRLPATLNVDRPSPHIDWSAGTVRLLTDAVGWPVTDHPRTAAVSSFGISGTNAHVILRQAPAPAAAAGRTDDGVGLPLWPLSARTRAALCAQADRLHEHLVGHPELDLSDVAYSLAATRTHHPYRAVITAPVGGARDPRDDLLDALAALRAGQPHPQLTEHHYLGHRRGKTVFVLPGQGGQYPGMGREPYEHNRVFADAVDACDAALRPFTEWSVREVLCQDQAAPPLERVDVVQPVLFTMMVALGAVLDSYGIRPDAVIGHSQGEIAAAYLAGVLSLPDAATVVARRSQALGALSGAGTMASVLLGADDVRARLRPWGEAVSIAAVNGPSHTIISGTPAALDEFSAACDGDGINIRPIAVDYASHSAQIAPLRERLLAQLADVIPAPSRVPLYSTVGETFSAGPLDTTTMDADYWYRNLREPVRFHDRVVELLAAGECTFVELSAHPVLAPALTDTLAQAGGRPQSAVIITLHRDRPDRDSLATASAQLHNHGHSPSWPALYPYARPVGLPTYPFEHRRYWVAPAPTGDAGGLGLDRAEHPLLGAVAALADHDQIMISGRLSPSTQSWLAGHRVSDTVLFPATGFIEVLLRAGELAGAPVIDELVLHTAMTLSEQAPTDLQILVQPYDQRGRRPFTVHSRTAAHPWMLHASGALSPDQPAAGPPLTPAAGVEAIDQDDFYERLAQRGYRYGGLFRSLHGIGTDPARPDVVYAEVALPAGTEVTGYGIHPALLDAALHPLAAVLDHTDSASLRLPYAFSGITLSATAATQLNVQLTRTAADTFELRATDPTGAPVITINTITLREVSDQIGGPTPISPSDSLFELAWQSVPEHLTPSASAGTICADPAAVTPCPDLLIWPLPGTQGAETDPLRRVHTLTRHVLAQLQSWLARPDTANSTLIIVTRHAVSISAHDAVPDLAHAAAWALIHTAQNEHPNRIILLDTDNDAATKDDLLAVASTRPSGEPQLALRNGIAHIPRLARTQILIPPDAPVRPAVLESKGTVLITGGTGALGAIFAEHLVTRHGIKHLLLLSRRGPDAPGASELQQRLALLGAQVTVSACDVSDPAALSTALDTIAASHPLTAVIHTAGVVADAVVSELSPQQLDAVLAAKADSAWYLHHLTAERDLAAFVLFSSAAGILGSPGAANYAAANAFLDALARHRHHTHRRATSLAWGYWQTPAGIAHLNTIELTRLTSTGLIPFTTEHGLALFDAALSSQQPNLLASPFSSDALTRQARHNTLDPILCGLTTSRPQAATASPRTLAARLATQTLRQRRDTITAMVTATTAAVLAYPDPAALDPDRPFKDLGIDSLTALELRNTLNEQTGLTLPATLALDQPTPLAVACHLADVLIDTVGPAVPAPQIGMRGDEPADNRLAHSDQGAFLALRAVHGALMQVTWIYRRGVSVEGLQRFQRNLGCGLLGRRVERSPLPFARDRWVVCPASETIDIAARPRRRAEVSAWADERAQLPIDPEWGPGWHLGVLPIEDGGTAVSLVVSHTLVDATGFLQAITDAAEGRTRDLGYPAARSRTRRRAIREDLRETVKDLPDIAQALVAVARSAWPHREERKSAIKAAPTYPKTARDDQTLEMPTVMAHVGLAEWDACAKHVGASSNSLVAGLACRLAVRVGRVHQDGAVTLRLLASLRTKDDIRGNAHTTVDVTVDPTHAATDLREMHVKITHAVLAAMEDSNDKNLVALPLTAITPKRVIRRLVEMAPGADTLPVFCSNLGDLPPAAYRPDGTDADDMYLTNLWPDRKKSMLESMGGQLFLTSGRGRGKIFVRISAYLPGRPNSADELREISLRTFAEFDLTAEFGC